MNHPLKILLIACALIVALYAATPLWLGYVFSRQLPPSWRLEELKTAYPGISGINIDVVRVRGQLQVADITLAASDVHFRYAGLKTNIESLALDVYVMAGENNNANGLTLDDLSLPITKLTGQIPALSVANLQLVLHPAKPKEPTIIDATRPLVLNFQRLNLLPATSGDFRLRIEASFEDMPGVSGQLEVKVGTNSRRADMVFPAGTNTPPWLSVSLQQDDDPSGTTTQLQASFVAEHTKQAWLPTLLKRGTGGFLTQLSGRLEIEVDFNGDELQAIKHVSLSSERLQAGFADGALTLDGSLSASRDGDNISVTLPGPAELQYQDKAGSLNQLIAKAIPELQRNTQPFTMAHIILGSASDIGIQVGPELSMTFSGAVDLDLASTESTLRLQSSELQVEIEDFSNLGSPLVQGQITLNWEESKPLSYTDDALVFKADGLSLSSSGLIYHHELITNFEQSGSIEVLHPLISLISEGNSPPKVISADRISAKADVTADNGALISSGNGTFFDSQVTIPATLASRVDFDWQEFDLLTLAGNLSTKTQNLVVELDDASWSGFDIDVTYVLQSTTDIDGSGSVRFNQDLDVPIRFTGNAKAEQWHIILPSTTIQLPQLHGLLRVAHIELPESIKFTDGYIEIQGAVTAADDFSSEMSIAGYQMGASMLESNAQKVSFTFDTNYRDVISANGPILVEIAALAGGIDIFNISADLDMKNPQNFELNNLSADVFDGHMSFAKLHISDSVLENTTIQLADINLGRLLAYADVDGLDGSGKIGISLPIGSDQVGVYIKNGTFNSNGPGHLAYTKEGFAGSNIGLQALENFQYQDLSGTINYQSDGGYQMNIHLEGKNPDLYGGHPIVFNLNIDGILPELFEAMLMTGDFEKSILNQVRTNQME